jgi:hypothetical protein
MGVAPEVDIGAICFSLGPATSRDEIDYVAACLADVLAWPDWTRRIGRRGDDDRRGGRTSPREHRADLGRRPVRFECG